MSRSRKAEVEGALEGFDESLLDVVDHVLTKGVVVTGDLVIGIAQIDLVYLRVSAVLCAADRLLGPAYASPKKRRDRHLAAAHPTLAGQVGKRRR